MNLTTSDGLEAAQKFRTHIARGGEIAQGRFNLEKVRKPHPITELLQRYHKHAASYKASYSGEKYVLQGLKKYFSGRYLSDVTTWAVEKWKRERAQQVAKSVAGHVFLRGPHAPQRRGRWYIEDWNSMNHGVYREARCLSFAELLTPFA